MDVAVEAGSFKTLAKALQVAGFGGDPQGQGAVYRLCSHGRGFCQAPAGNAGGSAEGQRAVDGCADLPRRRWFLPSQRRSLRQRSLSPCKDPRSKSKSAMRGWNVSGAKAIKTDIMQASNGIIHVIDAVIFAS